MIRPNESPEPFDRNAFSNAKKREFTGILTAIRPFWDQYMADPEAHTARGMLGTRTGIAYTADMSFDESKKHISLIVRLPLGDGLDTQHMCVLLRLQNQRQGLASLIFDAENQMLILVSRSVLPTMTVAEEVVTRVVADALSILEDDGLRNLMN